MEALERTITSLERRVDALLDDVSNAEAERDLVRDENEKVEMKLVDLTSQLERLRRDLEDANKREQVRHLENIYIW